MKVGLLVVAYEASATLEAVLHRIPNEVRSALSVILVCDDASTDDTFQVGMRVKQARPDLPLEVIRRPVNLGYGGNQKAGYHWMIDHGVEVVVLLHGDGQYAPEFLPQMLQPIVSGQADVVFGSRMLERGAALRGGMPKYKFAGNKILTFLQNRLAGVRLSEWHSGYRAYSVRSLAGVGFELNADYYDFDTQIILQMIATRQRIVEIPIPTFYGDELSRVNGIRYAWRILRHTLQWKLSR
ncbi:MAG: glycosyltransferase family 2 protein [Ilumatobacteraceae bacterium]|nr:glycosyltransferase family 2 protein [Ilumatobacteraceae bacterium]